MITIWRPLKTDLVTQGWGENKAMARVDLYGNLIMPAKILAVPPSGIPQGYKSIYKAMGMLGHNGVDNLCWHGEPIYHSASFAGWMKTEHDNAGGLGVDIVSQLPLLACTEPGCDQIHYVKMRYWHGMSVMPGLYDGKVIQPGEAIMRGDSSGMSGGDHLHWSPKWCDAKGIGLHEDNGYSGAFDAKPFFENYFVCDALKMKEIQLSIIEKITQIIYMLRQGISKM